MERESFYEDDYGYGPQEPKPVHPGANTGSGPWAPGYDPGASWNDGVKPQPDSLWDMTDNNWTTPAAPQPFTNPAPIANTAAPPPPTGGGATGGGAVAPISGGGGGGQSAINIPGAQLPSNIQSLFNQKPTQTPIQSAYQDALLKFMGKSQETPSLDDSVLGPQTEVFRAQQQRNTERNRRVSAERAAANGMGQSGYLDNQIQQGEQAQGFNTASFNANLLGGEMNKRREQLQAALAMASQTGNQEATRELQARLAQVNAAMQQQGLNLQGQLGMGDLDLRWMLGTEGLNQRAVQMLGL